MLTSGFYLFLLAGEGAAIILLTLGLISKIKSIRQLSKTVGS
jgi:hypothetical protein